MQNGSQYDSLDFYLQFATKQEHQLLELKVDEVVKASAGMSKAVENLTISVEKINNNLDILVVNKRVHEKIRICAIKVIIYSVGVTSSIVIPLLVANFVGLIKIFGKWLLN